ncbi:SDR family NAD(P)-dependent oxidoreductase [Aureimonas leprariae]|uniref:SDR family oxidoreductase n=1 Tax=Plantimonas leprariae TaxID=2615207 RepID=A0A7V7PPT6_9HYPH|nr:SDR family oxidoreductase [Aureimonas leprariae]KAB0680030.1 SDR family oxidoreductase [Aureimonas leprariae]
MTNGFAPDLFADKRVVVTGAGRGIGAAVARAFLACGATVVAHAGRTDEYVSRDLTPGLASDRTARLTILTGDLARPGSGQKLAADILSGGERVDVLVNNAGTMVGRIMAADVTDEEYSRVLDLDIRSVVALTTALLPALKVAKDGAIVNTSSISARAGGSAGSSLYSGAKGFLSSWTRSLAREVAPDGIRVNAVSPGTIMTDFHRRYSSEEKLRATAEAIPLKRLGTAEDCAGAYLFLASNALAAYVTGQVIEVNGGQLMP